LPAEYGRKPVFTSWTAGASLDGQLTGKQVLLVLDDANGGLDEYGKANTAVLQAWFRQGGVVIVLSGTTMSGDKAVATGTFQFLAGSGLLAVGAPNVLGLGSATVYSPKDEPVGRDAATPYTIEESTVIGFYAPAGGWTGVQVAGWAGAGFAPMHTVVHKYKAAPPLADDFDKLDLWEPQNSTVRATQNFTAGFDGVPSMAFPVDVTPHQLRSDLRLGNSERVLSAWVSLDGRGAVWLGFAGAGPEGTTFVQLAESSNSLFVSFRETRDWKGSTALTAPVSAPFVVGGWYEVELRVSAAGSPTVRVFDRAHRLVVEQTYTGVVSYAGRSVSLGGASARVDSLGIFRR
jgi:hypothetical protein